MREINKRRSRSKYAFSNRSIGSGPTSVSTSTSSVNPTIPTNVANITAIAGSSLGGNRAVYLNDSGQIVYADNNSPTCRKTIGLTTGAASAGVSVTVQTEGIFTEPSWSWSGDEPVWLSSNGLLTQTVPTSGYLLQVGVPAGPTKLRIDPQLVAKI